MRAIAVAVGLASSPMHAHAATELALRFFDDNAAAQGATLSARAHAEIESVAGAALLARGRDADGAFRFQFAHEPDAAELRGTVNRLRATGALVYADVASDARGALAKQYRDVDHRPVTSVIVWRNCSNRSRVST